jgi:hypothetical protein
LIRRLIDLTLLHVRELQTKLASKNPTHMHAQLQSIRYIRLAGQLHTDGKIEG